MLIFYCFYKDTFNPSKNNTSFFLYSLNHEQVLEDTSKLKTKLGQENHQLHTQNTSYYLNTKNKLHTFIT